MSSIEEIQIVTFNIGGTVFGTDMEPIAEIRELSQIDEEEIQVCWFHEIVSFQNRLIAYKFPNVLLLKDEFKLYGVIIEQPTDISVSVKIDSIQPLPTLIAACCRSSPIWGAIIPNQTIILLVDLIVGVRCKV